MKAEIYKRGPIAVGVNAKPLLEYVGGVFNDRFHLPFVDHIVSIVGWGYDEKIKK